MEKFNQELGKITNDIQESISKLANYVVEEDLKYENLSLEQKGALVDALRYLINARDTLSSLPE